MNKYFITQMSLSCETQALGHGGCDSINHETPNDFLSVHVLYNINLRGFND